jgi:hypothetical protein
MNAAWTMRVDAVMGGSEIRYGVGFPWP